MVAIHLICVGKLKEKHFAAACAEYEKRLGPFCRLTVTELAEERLPEDPSQAQIDAALEKEAGRIREKLPKGGKLVALCVEGKLLSSPDLARTLSGWMVEGASSVHVPHDLPPPSGPGDGPGAGLPGLPDQRRDPVS